MGVRLALAGELKDRVRVLPCDLADKDAVEALVPSTEEKMQLLWPYEALQLYNLYSAADQCFLPSGPNCLR